MPFLRRLKSGFVESLLIHTSGLFLLALIIVPLFPYLGAAEGRLWPVAQTAEIVSIKPDGAAASIIRLKITLSRSCAYESMSWQRVLPDGSHESVRIDTAAVFAPAVEGVMTQEWRVAMSVEDLKTRSIAYVWHRCHPLWSVISQFYP